MTSSVDPNTLSARLSEASALRNAGRVPEAIAAYRDVLAMEPNLPDSWYNLGWLLRRNGQPSDALDAYDEALARNITGPEEVWLNIGVIHADDFLKPDAAIEAYEQALKLKEDFVPALFNLANTHEDLGQVERAVALYQKILEIAPMEAEPLARIANMSRPTSLEDAIVKHVDEARVRQDIPAASRASLEFAFGRMLDFLGEYDAAFAAYERANQASESVRPPNYPGFDLGRSEAIVDALKAMPAPSPRSLPPSPIQPVFILGQFRSGSTLLEQILSGHSQVSTMGELPLLAQIAARRFSPYPAKLADASEEELAYARGEYFKGLENRRPGLSGFVTDKRPDNYFHIGMILRLFPEARILHTVRDARDVCLSTFFAHLDLHQVHATDLKNIARHYRAYEELMAHWKSLEPDQMLDVPYDTLVNEPEQEVRRVLDFLGLPFEQACLEFHASSAPVKTASVWQVREPLYTRSSGRWRNYEKHLGPMMEVLDGKTR
ncbi:MAG: sulfotransferase [Hyphomonas sp.]|nr:sulfotransferase [Hyphomonas sp.]